LFHARARVAKIFRLIAPESENRQGIDHPMNLK